MTHGSRPRPRCRPAGLLLGAAVLLTGALLAGCTTTTGGSGQSASRPAASRTASRTASHTTAGTASPSAASPSASRPAPRARAVPVHASFAAADGTTFGVGMPIVMRFAGRVTDAAAFRRAVTVTVNGAPAGGSWFFEPSARRGFALEAHYRTAQFWPAHSRIHVDAPLAGVPAGRGRAFDDDLTLSIAIGADHESRVDASSTAPRMVVRSDGRVVRTLPVSLGAARTPTYRGVKIVEEFDRVENMGGTPVPWSVRVTNSGEFVHAAPWNSEIGRANLSHGCTNLSTADARWFFTFSRLGDVVAYPNAPGPPMQSWDGLGDWNVPWTTWRAGGRL